MFIPKINSLHVQKNNMSFLTMIFDINSSFYSFREDLLALAKNRSFVLATCGFTCVTFSAGALMWWGPQFAFLGDKAEKCATSADCEKITQADIAYKFGIVMTFAGEF